MKKIKNFILMAVVFILVGFIFALNLSKQSKAAFLTGNKPMNIQMPDTEKILKKIKVQDVVIENINSKKELVTLETDLFQEVKWDDSFTDWEIFEKYQTIIFYGKAKFSTDLNQVTKGMINYVPESNILTIKIKKPIISSLEILEEKTEVYSTNNGLLRFGEIKISASEHNELMKKVKSSMYLELGKDEIKKQAEESTIQAIKELGQLFLSGIDVDDVNINVVLI